MSAAAAERAADGRASRGPTPPRPRGSRRRIARDADPFAYLLDLPADLRAEAVELLGEEHREALARHWAGWAHDGQRPPPGDWRSWVLMAGRGFGKTRAGAEWVADAMRADGRLRVALVAATIDEARLVMVDGPSGLLAVAGRSIEAWVPSRRWLRFANGAEATLFSGANPDKLRGPEHHLAWCDELAKWEKPGETWDMLQLGLRLGANPRALVTTTPRAGPVLRRIMAEPGCVVTGGRTGDNPHTSAAYKENVERVYGGTRLGAQELDGVLLPDGGALWTPEVLERCRAADDLVSSENGEGPGGPFARVVIGVDPPSGDGTCGVVACALDSQGVGHVLADHSVVGRSPEGWARAVADAADVHGTRVVIAERNQGGRMVDAVLRAADRTLAVKLVHASDGKATRADPVALLFEAGRVRLHGRLPELEAELLGMVAGAPSQGPGGGSDRRGVSMGSRASPDRADAMVWALTELMLGRAGRPGVRMI